MDNSLTTLSSILNLINIPITMNDELTNILQDHLMILVTQINLQIINL